MKLFHFVRLVGILASTSLLLSLTAPAALARSKDTIRSSSAAAAVTRSESSAGSGDAGWSLGFSTITYAIGNSAITLPSSLTGLLHMSGGNYLQLNTTIIDTNPFQFMVSGLFKHDLSSRRGAGFHIGGGLGLGVQSTGGGTGFALAINPLAGFHFPFTDNSPVSVHLDGGPIIYILDGSAAFRMSASSYLLGATLVYAL